ncbi:MAG: S-layer homology domain-containing protein [Syntrophomonadaceae bacterium]|nr:S-layer homology domain-containing protein [Syntrophomonadaceae bacterium]MDD3888355.1 S-layer homology domain-containing protein [Syntrophomonadaceae bacterium]MDD4548861.1 S-layer homology domain-containing protein [Syntrophomonadaceae bacterium]
MLKKLSITLIFTLLLTFGYTPDIIGAVNYRDIQNHWAQSEITSLTVSGYINGYPDGFFRPNNYISRAEFVTALLACLELKPGNIYPYSTPDNTHWAQIYIDDAISRGIIIPTEYPWGFNPDQDITRAESAAMIVRALGEQPDYNRLNFIDWNIIKKNPYQGYVKVAFDEGIITGFSNGEFRPNDNLTRAQACTVLSKFLYKAFINPPSSNSGAFYKPAIGKSIEIVTLGEHRYNPDYVEIYVDSRDSGYFLADVEVINDYILKIGSKTYDLNDSRISVRLQNDYYKVQKILNENGRNTIKLQKTAFGWDNIKMADIYAIYSGSRKILSEDIDKLQFRINGKKYNLSEISIDKSGYFKVNRTSYPFSKVTVVADGNDYDLDDIEERNGQIIFYCDSNSGDSRRGDNSRYIKPDEFLFYEDGYSYPWKIDNIEIYINNKWQNFKDIKIIDEDYYEFKNKSFRLRNSHLRRYYHEFEIIGTYWNYSSREMEITIEEIN